MPPWMIMQIQDVFLDIFGVTVFDEPACWFISDEQDDYFKDLKKLVEDTYELNHQAKITFFAHSLGNLYLLYFLNRQTQDWKDKYVNAFVGMGGPWGGAVKALKVMATGDDLDIPIVSGSKMRDVLRTNPSVRACEQRSVLFIMNSGSSNVFE